MTNKLFVGGLSWGTTDADLLEAFSQFGRVVEAKVITDRDTGRSRGFGFVTYEESQDAEAAMKNMDGTSLDSRTIRVNEAQERQDRGGGRGGPRGGPGGGGGRGRPGGGRGRR